MFWNRIVGPDNGSLERLSLYEIISTFLYFSTFYIFISMLQVLFLPSDEFYFSFAFGYGKV